MTSRALELRFFDRTGTVQPVRVPSSLSVLQVKQLLVARDGFGQDLAPEHLTLSVGRQRLADGVVVERHCADGYPIGIAVAAADGIRKPGADPKWLDDVGLAVARVNLGVTVDGVLFPLHPSWSAFVELSYSRSAAPRTSISPVSTERSTSD